MSGWARWIAAVAVATLAAGAAQAGEREFGFGRPATAEEIRAWDNDVRPDGAGLPTGGGGVVEGEALYSRLCASCHGEFGEGEGRYPALMGGGDTLASDDPRKTVGSYWPYATTLFDYIRRAMPFGDAQSLSPNETYALTAYVLFLSDIVDEARRLDRAGLSAIEMPNRAGFKADDRLDEAWTRAAPCMVACKSHVKIIGVAKRGALTPEAGAGEGKRR